MKRTKFYCECGCGKEVTWNKGKKCWNRFVHGHNINMVTKEDRQHRVELYKQNCLNKYGVNNPQKVKSIKQKSVETRQKRYTHWMGNLDEAGIKRFKDFCSKGGKKGGASTAKRWKEYPNEFKDFLDASHEALRNNEEARARISYKQMGIHNHNWQGGKTLNGYSDDWLDEEYKSWLKIERDNSKCQNPSCPGNSIILVLHHIDINPKNGHPMNLITLCYGCHMKAHRWHVEKWVKFYKDLMKKRAKNDGWKYKYE